MDVKKNVFTRLDKIAKPGAILASNTSFLDIDEIAAVTSRPDHVLGLHFFSPAPVMKLLEIVRGAKTSDSVLATAMKLAKTIGKVGVLAGNAQASSATACCGSARTRPTTGAGRRLALCGGQGADRFRLSHGHLCHGRSGRAGSGLERGGSHGETLRESSLRSGTARPEDQEPAITTMTMPRKAAPSPVAEKMIADFRTEKSVTPAPSATEEIRERCLLPMINEGAKILEEGKASRASDIDIVWLYGYGWPAYRGGPMFYADSLGLGAVIAGLKKYGIAPAPLLEKLAAANKRISDFA